MKLYGSLVTQFVQDVEDNKIDDLLAQEYFNYYGHLISQSEKRSFANSLRFIKDLLNRMNAQDNYIVCELELPFTNKRIDVLLYGKDGSSGDNVVLIELKQWDKVAESDVINSVIVKFSHGEEEKIHPAQQVLQYRHMLEDLYEEFEIKPELVASSCSYLHNYAAPEPDPLFTNIELSILKESPVFKKNDVVELAEYLSQRLCGGAGLQVYQRFDSSKVRPSKRLIEEFKIMKNKSSDFTQRFFLIDDQLLAKNAIVSYVKKAKADGEKTVIIVDGGPGTGKSVIALESMIEMMKQGQVVFYATGGGAMTQTLKKAVGVRAADYIKYFYSFTQQKDNAVDVIMCDEAHRLKKHSNDYGVPYMYKSKEPQVDDIIRPAKVSVFFIDELQNIRPNEVGSKQYIEQSAMKFGAKVKYYELTTQFRCSGSDRYLQWVDNLLGLRETDYSVLPASEPMQFKIVDSPHELKRIIDEKNDLKRNSARMAAGYCWYWSDPIEPDKHLAKDVVIGDFEMPWEAKWGKDHTPDVPDAALWATDVRGEGQIGTIYTAQGFEFDYIGVIFGEDLVYRKEFGGWVGQQDKTFDKALKKKDIDYTTYFRHIYRVLLSRAHYGVYVYFLDLETQEYVKSRLEAQ